jgi:hypothetical protein
MHARALLCLCAWFPCELVWRPQEGEAEEETVLLTILESVIIQTSLYALRSKGRLAVYWGDQVFVPTENFNIGDSPVST